MRNAKLSSAIPFCKVCFRDIGPRGVHPLVKAVPGICHSCYSALNPRFRHWRFKGVPFLSIFDYTEGMQSLLFQFKGCFDIELAPLFLEYPLPLLKAKYRGYCLVPAPSSDSHNQRRGFNHVVEAFSSLGLPILPLLKKTSDRKQTDCTVDQRREVGKIIALTKPLSLKGKKILFVDDVFTTGSTALACLKLIASCRPKKVAGLVLSKTLPK